nr:sugar porter family MFS transporter [Acetobacter senegalensis]
MRRHKKKKWRSTVQGTNCSELNRSNEEKTEDNNSNNAGPWLGQASLFALAAGLAGLMFGLDTGVIAGALHFIGLEFHTTTVTDEWIVSTLMLGAAFGALLASFLAREWGRRVTLSCAAVLFLAGTAACCFAHSVPVLMAGRVVLGLGVGLAAFAAPLYISEITAQKDRGRMISLYQMAITIGMLMAYFSDSLLAGGGHWRWMLGIPAIPAVFFLLSTLVVPYSPRWLVTQGRHKEASRVLHMLRDSSEKAKRELTRIRQQVNKENVSGFELFKTSAPFRRSFFLGLSLQALQQLTGINVLLYYAPKVLERAHFGSAAAIWATTLLGVANLAATVAALFLIDRWGRRPLLVTSCIIASLSLVLFGFVLQLHVEGTLGAVLIIGTLVAFILGYALGEGPLPWTLCSEIQPLKGRSLAIGCSTFVNWITNWLISTVFLSCMTVLGDSVTFWMLAGFNMLFLVVALLFVPETKGTSLEDIEDNLMRGERLRDIGGPATPQEAGTQAVA